MLNTDGQIEALLIADKIHRDILISEINKEPVIHKHNNTLWDLRGRFD